MRRKIQHLIKETDEKFANQEWSNEKERQMLVQMEKLRDELERVSKRLKEDS